jgi:hypothetical protein
MFLPKSFKNLVNISRSPHISRYVTGLTYESAMLEEASQDVWLRYLEPPFSDKAGQISNPEFPIPSLTEK